MKSRDKPKASENNGKIFTHIYVDEAAGIEYKLPKIERLPPDSYGRPIWYEVSPWLELQQQIPEIVKVLRKNEVRFYPYKK